MTTVEVVQPSCKLLLIAKVNMADTVLHALLVGTSPAGRSLCSHVPPILIWYGTVQHERHSRSFLQHRQTTHLQLDSLAMGMLSFNMRRLPNMLTQ